MKSLAELWDATGRRSDKGSAHSYIEWYETALAPFRDCEAVLELGIFHGASIDLWRAYFTRARVVGVDVNPHISPQQVVDYRAADVRLLLRTDAYTRGAVEQVRVLAPNGYQVIIDDGSHIEEHQQFVLQEYVRLLAPGGLLVIEDIQVFLPNGHPGLLEALLETAKTLDGCITEVVDRTNVKDRYDDILLTVRRQ